MALKISVIIPVYNPGEALSRSVNSLLAQTMPPEEWEAIFVDDGATDGSAERLDRLAAQHPHIRVHHQENSGWPSKPRNVALGMAEGTYVQFLDQDDELAPEALERMYAIAERNGSDIVLGKEGGTMVHGPGIWRATVERCNIADMDLIGSLAPHKMFRRAFLDEHGIRFPEDRRRLEDQIFMTRAYLAAGTVSILADYTCYYWQRREDGGNASGHRKPTHARDYYAALGDVFDIIDEKVPPGPERDRLRLRFFKVEMLRKLQTLPRQPEDYRLQLYNEIRSLVLAKLTPGIEAQLSPVNRVRAALTVADRMDDLMILASRLHGVRPLVRIEDMQWRGSALRIRVSAGVHYPDDEPVLLVERKGRRYLDPRLTDGTALAGGLEVGSALGDLTLHGLLKQRDDPVEWYQPMPSTSRLERTRARVDGRALRLVLDGHLDLDPERWQTGAPAANGLWDVRVGVQALGLGGGRRIGASRSARVERGRLPGVFGDPSRVVVPYWTRPGSNLSFEVAAGTPSLAREIGLRGVRGGQVRDGRLRLPLGVAAAPGTPGLPVEAVVSGRGPATTMTGTLVPGTGVPVPGRADLVLPMEPRPGTHRLALRGAPRQPPVPVARLVVPRRGHRVLTFRLRSPAAGVAATVTAQVAVARSFARSVAPAPARRLARRALRWARRRQRQRQRR